MKGLRGCGGAGKTMPVYTTDRALVGTRAFFGGLLPANG